MISFFNLKVLNNFEKFFKNTGLIKVFNNKLFRIDEVFLGFISYFLSFTIHIRFKNFCLSFVKHLKTF